MGKSAGVTRKTIIFPVIARPTRLVTQPLTHIHHHRRNPRRPTLRQDHPQTLKCHETKSSPFSIFNSQFSINMSELDLYISLFITFFKIGLFGFGGGYAMLSLIQHDVVETHNWISVADFTDIVAISQSTPGPIAFNTATYIGYTATGSIWGSAICTIAVSLPLPDHHDHDLQVLFLCSGTTNTWKWLCKD